MKYISYIGSVRRGGRTFSSPTGVTGAKHTYTFISLKFYTTRAPSCENEDRKSWWNLLAFLYVVEQAEAAVEK